MEYILDIQFFGGRGASYYSGKDRQLLSGKRGRPATLHPIDVSKYQGKTLSEVENKIRTLTRERLFAFDKDGNVIEAYQRNGTSVYFPERLLDVKGATVTHNHPKGYSDFGGTFSFADVYNKILR